MKVAARWTCVVGAVVLLAGCSGGANSGAVAAQAEPATTTVLSTTTTTLDTGPYERVLADAVDAWDDYLQVGETYDRMNDQNPLTWDQLDLMVAQQLEILHRMGGDLLEVGLMFDAPRPFVSRMLNSSGAVDDLHTNTYLFAECARAFPDNEPACARERLDLGQSRQAVAITISGMRDCLDGELEYCLDDPLGLWS